MTESSHQNDSGSPKERRQYLRLDRSSSIRYQHLDSIAEQVDMKDAELCDFGGGGIRFLTPEQLKKNEQIVIELHFGGWKEENDEWIRTGNNEDVGHLKAIGAVMWCTEKEETPGTFEVGLRFTGRIRD